MRNVPQSVGGTSIDFIREHLPSALQGELAELDFRATMARKHIKEADRIFAIRLVTLRFGKARQIWTVRTYEQAILARLQHNIKLLLTIPLRYPTLSGTEAIDRYMELAAPTTTHHTTTEV